MLYMTTEFFHVIGIAFSVNECVVAQNAQKYTDKRLVARQLS